MSIDNTPERCNHPYKGQLCAVRGECYLWETLFHQIQVNMNRPGFRDFVEELLKSSAGCARIGELREFAEIVNADIPEQEQTIDLGMEELFGGDPDLINEYFNSRNNNVV